MANNNNFNFWFWLSVAADMAQLQSYEMLLQDSNNNDLMKYLKHQDNDLLQKIIKQNEEILQLLKGGQSDAHTKND